MKDIVIEFFGTCLLIFIIFASGNPYIIGLTLCLLILFGTYIGSSKFGCNFNPAVSFTNYMLGNISFTELVLFITSQILAAFSAFALYKYYIA